MLTMPYVLDPFQGLKNLTPLNNNLNRIIHLNIGQRLLKYPPGDNGLDHGMQ